MPDTKNRGSLLVVGTGINGVPQTTLEAAAAIRNAEKVLYIVVDPVTEAWIRMANPPAATLSDLYAPGKHRRETYAEMTERIVSAVRQGLRVCVVFYGHPGVFVETSHTAIAELRAEGYDARMLPGVSSDACLYADLGVNPGQFGIQSFEATDFLRARRLFDPTSNLLLWQIGVLGNTDARPGLQCRPERLQVLVDRLRPHYPTGHQVVLYYASMFPGTPPVIERVTLDGLADAQIAPMALLFVPAAPQRPRDPDIERWAEES